MWKVWHLLFGWDYITWQNSASQGIARVHRDYNGNLYFWQYKGTRVAGPITTAERHLWLTCKPEKYLKQHRGDDSDG